MVRRWSAVGNQLFNLLRFYLRVQIWGWHVQTLYQQSVTIQFQSGQSVDMGCSGLCGDKEVGIPGPPVQGSGQHIPLKTEGHPPQGISTGQANNQKNQGQNTEQKSSDPHKINQSDVQFPVAAVDSPDAKAETKNDQNIIQSDAVRLEIEVSGMKKKQNNKVEQFFVVPETALHSLKEEEKGERRNEPVGASKHSILSNEDIKIEIKNKEQNPENSGQIKKEKEPTKQQGKKEQPVENEDKKIRSTVIKRKSNQSRFKKTEIEPNPTEIIDSQGSREEDRNMSIRLTESIIIQQSVSRSNNRNELQSSVDSNLITTVKRPRFTASITTTERGIKMTDSREILKTELDIQKA